MALLLSVEKLEMEVDCAVYLWAVPSLHVFFTALTGCAAVASNASFDLL